MKAHMRKLLKIFTSRVVVVGSAGAVVMVPVVSEQTRELFNCR